MSVASTATARKLGLIYRLIKDGKAYKQLDLQTYELKYKEQILRSLNEPTALDLIWLNFQRPPNQPRPTSSFREEPTVFDRRSRRLQLTG
jgi:hypothetical protein